MENADTHHQHILSVLLYTLMVTTYYSYVLILYVVTFFRLGVSLLSEV